ncbi:MAG: carbonic anhydrase [Fibrobacterota bacterium]|nr:carbonic anhydrase [Fibrobacterota bacterium]QQS06478.1 MAG: carbonic anhydrase [Fibrobacterota bacterium]
MCESCPSTSRRSFLKTMGLGALAVTIAPRSLFAGHGEEPKVAKATKATATHATATHATPTAHATHASAGVTPDEALTRLLEGNKRFIANRMFHPNEGMEQRAKLATGQWPFAAVLGCADSRVPPEIVFDHGLGDIFTVRVAGNIVEDAGSGSMEYAIEHLGVPLIVVLGHERCGAIKATIEALETQGEVPGHIGELVKKLKPAVDGTKSQPGDKVDNAVRENAKRMAAELANMDPILREKVKEGKLKVVAMRYDLDTGSVELL